MNLASSLRRRMKRVVLVVVVDAKVAVEVIAETVEIGVDGRTRAAMMISRTMMIARLASWAPVRAKRSDRVVDVMVAVAAIVVIAVIVVIVVVTVSVATADAKSVVTAVTAESRVSVRSVHPSLVNVNSVSRSS
jgi:hypothetical protein